MTSPSFDAEADQLDGPGKCGAGTPLTGLDGKPVNGRCGPGTRLPFLVISPWAKANFVSHDRISLASVVRFIEDNWLHGERLGGGSFDATAGSVMAMFDLRGSGNTAALYLDPATGTPVSSTARCPLTRGQRHARSPAHSQAHWPSRHAPARVVRPQHRSRRHRGGCGDLRRHPQPVAAARLGGASGRELAARTG